ncbi:MAG: GNAT family N-acetyltransferase [Bacteroidia bacterium]
MDQVELIKALQSDIAELQEIGRQTFFETFADCNTEENMQKYLSESYSLEKLTNEISNVSSEFYLASLNKKTIGYLKINFDQAQTEFKDKQSLEIERIYVLKEFHGKKIGQLLYNHALQVAMLKNSNYVWLGVWEENARAISFYRKLGFVEFDKHIFRLGEDEQTDILMKLELK